MGFRHAPHRGQHLLEQHPIAGHLRVALERMKEPERGVRGVIQPLIAAVGEHVRNEAVAYVLRERAQDETRLAVPSRRERQPLETDHRVTAPIGEPVIAGDDGAQVVPDRGRAHRIVQAPDRFDHELIGREHQLRGLVTSHRRARAGDQTTLALPLQLQRLRGGHGPHHLERLRRSDERRCLSRFYVHDERAGRPERAPRPEPASLFHREHELVAAMLLVDEFRVSLDAHPQRWQARGRDAIVPPIGLGGELVLLVQWLRDGRLVVAKMHLGAESQRHGPPAIAMHSVLDDDRVLAVWHHDLFFHQRTVLAEAPRRRAALELELDQRLELERLRQRVEHDHPADRVRQRRHEKPVIPTRHDVRDRRRAVPTDPIRHEPLVAHRGGRVRIADGFLQRHATNGQRFDYSLPAPSSVADSAGIRHEPFSDSGGGAPRPP